MFHSITTFFHALFSWYCGLKNSITKLLLFLQPSNYLQWNKKIYAWTLANKRETQNSCNFWSFPGKRKKFFTFLPTSFFFSFFSSPNFRRPYSFWKYILISKDESANFQGFVFFIQSFTMTKREARFFFCFYRTNLKIEFYRKRLYIFIALDTKIFLIKKALFCSHLEVTLWNFPKICSHFYLATPFYVIHLFIILFYSHFISHSFFFTE